ncbi:hypothetical protein [Vibrio natriegens]|nr:hypothetical protein [Vibrio natriegens]
MPKVFFFPAVQPLLTDASKGIAIVQLACSLAACSCQLTCCGLGHDTPV